MFGTFNPPLPPKAPPCTRECLTRLQWSSQASVADVENYVERRESDDEEDEMDPFPASVKEKERIKVTMPPTPKKQEPNKVVRKKNKNDPIDGKALG